MAFASHIPLIVFGKLSHVLCHNFQDIGILKLKLIDMT